MKQNNVFHAILDQGAFLPFLTLLSFPSTFLAQSVNQKSLDLFPLRPKLHFQYSYDSRSEYLEINYNKSSMDSGVVDYVVLDSTLSSDTTVTWCILQKENLFHTRFQTYSPSIDTSYLTLRDTTITLTEYLTGMHQLSCSSWVWTFPTQYPPQSFYRFADTSQLSIVNHYSYGFVDNGFDSLPFAASYGLLGRWKVESSTHSTTLYFYSLMVTLLSQPTTVFKQSQGALELGIAQNYPNPFNSSTVISYSLLQRGLVSFEVFDILGRILFHREFGVQESGGHSFLFSGDQLASGVYFYRLRANGMLLNKRFVLLK